MHEKVIEIIVYLVGEMRNSKPLGEIDLKVLEESGYSPTEISNAFSWLFDRLATGESNAPAIAKPTVRSHRILHDVERMVIGREAEGFLIQLREFGILNDATYEAVIERAMMSGYNSVGVDEIKAIVCSLVFEREESKRIDNRFLSQWSDTIH